MKRFILFVLLIPVYAAQLFAQPSAPFNKYDSENRKAGVWMEQEGGDTMIREYKDGLLDGISMFLIQGQVGWIAVYDIGRLKMISYFDKGELVLQMYGFRNVDISLPNIAGGKPTRFDVQCCSRSFYPNGNVESEGLLLGWDESDMVVDSEKYGEWRYYDEDGKLKDTKVYDTTIYFMRPSDISAIGCDD